jgi:N1221-like protein
VHLKQSGTFFTYVWPNAFSPKKMNIAPEFKPLLLKSLNKPAFQPENFPTTLASNFSPFPGQSAWDFQPRLAKATMVSEIQDFYSHWDLSRRLFPAVENIDLETVQLLTSPDCKTRLEATRKVVAFSQGLMKPETRQDLDPENARLIMLQRIKTQLEAITLNNKKLMDLSTFQMSYKALKALMESISILGEGAVRDGAMLEISLHLSILYMMMVCCDTRAALNVITSENPYPPLYFFSLLDKLSDGNMKEFPVRKVFVVF